MLKAGFLITRFSSSLWAPAGYLAPAKYGSDLSQVAKGWGLLPVVAVGSCLHNVVVQVHCDTVN